MFTLIIYVKRTNHLVESRAIDFLVLFNIVQENEGKKQDKVMVKITPRTYQQPHFYH